MIGQMHHRYNGVRDRLCDEQGRIRGSVLVYVNDEDIRFLQSQGTHSSPAMRSASFRRLPGAGLPVCASPPTTGFCFQPLEYGCQNPHSHSAAQTDRGQRPVEVSPVPSALRLPNCRRSFPASRNAWWMTRVRSVVLSTCTSMRSDIRFLQNSDTPLKDGMTSLSSPPSPEDSCPDIFNARSHGHVQAKVQFRFSRPFCHPPGLAAVVDVPGAPDSEAGDLGIGTQVRSDHQRVQRSVADDIGIACLELEGAPAEVTAGSPVVA